MAKVLKAVSTKFLTAFKIIFELAEHGKHIAHKNKFNLLLLCHRFCMESKNYFGRKFFLTLTLAK